MEQQLFEELIKNYTIKVVSKDNPNEVSYVPNFKIRRQNHQVGAKRKRAPNKKEYVPVYRPVMTPAGLFESVQAAAEHYGITIPAIYGRISFSRKKGNKEYYFNDSRDEENT